MREAYEANLLSRFDRQFGRVKPQWSAKPREKKADKAVRQASREAMNRLQ